MKRNAPFALALLACAAALTLFACGDDSPSMPAEEEGSSSSGGGNGLLSSLVEISGSDEGTLEDQPACTATNAGTFGWVGKEQSYYVCYGFQWRPLVDVFDNMASLTACTESREGGLALVKSEKKILECSGMQWGAYHVPARSYVNLDALPSCVESRQWEYNYIEDSGTFALCRDEMWLNLIDVQEDADDLLACTANREQGMALIMRGVDTVWSYAYDTTGTGKSMKIDTTKSVDKVIKADTTLLVCSELKWRVYRDPQEPDTTTVVDTAGTGDNLKVDEKLPNVSGLRVSRWMGDGVLLLAWDQPDWKPDSVGGLVIERDKNYTGWKILDTLQGEEIRAALWADSSLDVTNQMKYRYRMYTVSRDTGSTARSVYSDIVGTMAVDAWGFSETGFDVPNGVTGCWMHGNQQHITWNVQRMANAGGWVLQALGYQDTVIDVDSTMAGGPAGFHPEGDQWLTRAAWFDLDTLSEDNNKYWIDWPMFTGYRLYAYYVDEYSGVTSEYSPEVNFSSIVSCFPADYPVYTSKSAAIKVDTAKAAVSWETPSAFYDCTQFTLNGAYYPPSCAAGAMYNVNYSCQTLTDEFGHPSPCWDLGFSMVDWEPGMPTDAKGYAVRGVVINRAGTGVWSMTTSSWSK